MPPGQLLGSSAPPTSPQSRPLFQLKSGFIPTGQCPGQTAPFESSFLDASRAPTLAPQRTREQAGTHLFPAWPQGAVGGHCPGVPCPLVRQPGHCVAHMPGHGGEREQPGDDLYPHRRPESSSAHPAAQRGRLEASGGLQTDGSPRAHQELGKLDCPFMWNFRLTRAPPQEKGGRGPTGRCLVTRFHKSQGHDNAAQP